VAGVRAIHGVSESLISLLETVYTSSPPAGFPPNPDFAMYLASQFKDADHMKEGISLFLYRVYVNTSQRSSRRRDPATAFGNWSDCSLSPPIFFPLIPTLPSSPFPRAGPRTRFRAWTASSLTRPRIRVPPSTMPSLWSSWAAPRRRAPSSKSWRRKAASTPRPPRHAQQVGRSRGATEGEQQADDPTRRVRP
jgi:hypothetical protein